MSVALCAAFLCSGAAALLFETLWFRLSRLGLGNSVWASSVVLAAFMAGLALGNVLGARYGRRVERPLVVFAALEGAVVVLSLGLVLALPPLTAWLAPLLAVLQERPLLLNGSRGTLAFLLMLLPATAMGVTLPLLARALAPHTAGFGTALGRLYGWNTLGGVLGAVAAETLLVPRLGLVRTALVAGGLNLVALLTAFLLDRRLGPLAVVAVAPEAVRVARVAPRSPLLRLLAAAFLAGLALLALEVVWFRFLQLFVFGSELAFALMLATVLAGIGLGGLLAAAWLRLRAEAPRGLALLAALAGVATVVTYAAFEAERGQALASEAARTLWLSLSLMLPTSLVSGVLFTLMGAAVREELPDDAGAAGWLTLANTIGAALGAPLAGLLLLPWLGIERSLFALALAYGAVALLVLPWSRSLPRPVLLVAAGVVALVTVLFPFGLMQGRFVRWLVLSTMPEPSARIVAFREGQVQTAILGEVDWGGAPVFQRLVTNAHSMTSSTFYARRYMKLFAYWPLALRPGSKRALLISYGLGNTAEALVRSRELTRIDVVDTSRTILELSPLAARAGAPDPLADPRVAVHVEDGRFFLRAQDEPYDLITAEPPPPRAAGIASLYSYEYFRLTRSRLAPGGIATHWLPVYQLTAAAARSVVRAFCDAFEDCSLWSGAGYDWMLVGSNGASAPDAAAFARLWSDPATGDDLRELGIERPEQLGSLFIADAKQLGAWAEGSAPVIDDRPGRLEPKAPSALDMAVFRELQAPRPCAERFAESEVVQRLWPAELREKSFAWFAWQGVFNADYEAGTRPEALSDLWAVLAETRLRTLPLLLLDSEPRIRATARSRHLEGGVHPALAFHLGAAALADRDYGAAARFFAAAGEEAHAFHSPRLLRALALALAGREQEARLAVTAVPPQSLEPHARPWQAWLASRLEGPVAAAQGGD